MDFWNLWKRKHCYRFTPASFHTLQYKTTRLAVISSHCRPIAVSSAKKVWGQQSHAEKRVNYGNWKWTIEDSLPCYCYTTTRSSRTMRSQVSQRESVGGVHMSELQAHHCITPCRTVKLAIVQCECHTGK